MSKDFSTVADDFNPDKKPTGVPAVHFDIKRFITLRLPMILLIGAVLALPLGFAGWYLTPVEFTAVAQVQYRSVGGIADGSGNGASAGEYNKFVNTEIAKLTGDNVLAKVLDNSSIQNLPSIRNVADKLTFLKGRVSARPVPQSELVNVRCTMGERREALDVLTVMIDIYERQALLEESSQGTMKIELVNKQIDAMERNLSARRKEIETLEGALGASNGGILPKDSIEAEQYRAMMLEAENRLKLAENEVKAVEGKIAHIKGLQEAYTENPASPIYYDGVESMVSQDSRVAALQADLVRQQNAVDQLKEAHPRHAAEKKALDSLRGNLVEQEQRVRGEVLSSLHSRALQNLELAKHTAAAEAVNLAENKQRYDSFIADEEAEFSEASEGRARLIQLRDAVTVDNNYLSGLKEKVKNMQLDEEAPPRVVIATAPYAPLTQGTGKKLLMALAGMCAALGIGLAYGVLRELFDQQIRTPQDITRISRLPIIAAIPHISEDTANSQANGGLLIRQQHNSIVADEYRRILARILFPEDNAAEISSLLVVSASPSEGKTSVATNLAVALEQANRKVLLVDLSSQRPSVERAFGLTPSLGLSDVLGGDEAREELIRRTAFENLGILGPGAEPNKLVGHLASREMMDFMEWADDHFDHIIVDTPPLLLMSDAKLLAPAMDGVLFVVGAGQSTLGMVSRSLRELELLRANVIGIVLNGVRSIRGGYLRENRKLFYSYTEGWAPQPAEDTMPEINVLDEDLEEPLDAEVVLLPFDHNDK